LMGDPTLKCCAVRQPFSETTEKATLPLATNSQAL
jgi:hypothetical protein